jgi:hypothetical protein
MNKEKIEQDIKDSLKMIQHYYSTNKPLKDMTITFYHSVFIQLISGQKHYILP